METWRDVTNFDTPLQAVSVTLPRRYCELKRERYRYRYHDHNGHGNGRVHDHGNGNGNVTLTAR